MSDKIEKDLFIGMIDTHRNQINLIDVGNFRLIDPMNYPNIKDHSESKLISNSYYTILYSLSYLYIYETSILYRPNNFQATSILAVSFVAKNRLSIVFENHFEPKSVKYYFAFFNIVNKDISSYPLTGITKGIMARDNLYFFEYDLDRIICFIDENCYIIDTNEKGIILELKLNSGRMYNNKILQISKHIYIRIVSHKMIMMDINGKNVKETVIDRINPLIAEYNYMTISNKEILAESIVPTEIIKISIDILKGETKRDTFFNIEEKIGEDIDRYQFSYDRESKTLAVLFTKNGEDFVYINDKIIKVDPADNIQFLRMYTKEKYDAVSKDLKNYLNTNILGIIKKLL